MHSDLHSRSHPLSRTPQWFLKQNMTKCLLCKSGPFVRTGELKVCLMDRCRGRAGVAECTAVPPPPDVPIFCRQSAGSRRTGVCGQLAWGSRGLQWHWRRKQLLWYHCFIHDKGPPGFDPANPSPPCMGWSWGQDAVLTTVVLELDLWGAEASLWFSRWVGNNYLEEGHMLWTLSLTFRMVPFTLLIWWEIQLQNTAFCH